MNKKEKMESRTEPFLEELKKLMTKHKINIVCNEYMWLENCKDNKKIYETLDNLRAAEPSWFYV